MANSEDYMVILHVDDGELWAKFLSDRLMGPNYGIKCIVNNLTCATSASWKKQSYPSGTGVKKSSSLNSKDLGDSGIGSRTITDRDIYSDCIDNAKAFVVLLSPDALTFEKFPFDVRVLNPKRTLFLLLGVDIEDVRAYFGKDSDHVFNSRCCVIHEDEKLLSDVMVEIIQAYEYPGDTPITEEGYYSIYETPPPPRQMNGIETVITRDIPEKERDVYILLERPAEEDLVAVLDNFPEEKIPVICVCDRLYKFEIPAHAKGKLNFKVQCQSYGIGEGSVLALTKLEQLKTILNEEVNPLSVIASALGLTSDDIDSIDTVLASRLQQLPSIETFEKLFPCEEALRDSLTDERSDVTYPSLLHFAADWNLRKFCKVLLLYPGMVDAAITENKDGDDPRSLAFNKGYMELESDLIEFVMANKPSDNDQYIEPSEPVRPPPPPPKPHTTGTSIGYVNMNSDNSGLYISMGNNKDFRKEYRTDYGSQRSDTGLGSPVSQGSDSVFTHGASVTDDMDGINYEIFSQDYSPDQTNSGATSKKALKILGVPQEDITKSKTSILNRVYTKDSQTNKSLTGNIPHAVRYPVTSHMVSPPDLKQKGNKITAFFSKIKSKRSASEGENTHMPSFGAKKTSSVRSEKLEKMPPDINNQERDSGSYSDEENGKKSSNSTRRNSKPKEFKERDKPMTRQRPLSRRVQIAKQERINDAPEVPSSSRRPGRFRSYIENS